MDTSYDTGRENIELVYVGINGELPRYKATAADGDVSLFRDRHEAEVFLAAHRPRTITLTVTVKPTDLDGASIADALLDNLDFSRLGVEVIETSVEESN